MRRLLQLLGHFRTEALGLLKLHAKGIVLLVKLLDLLLLCFSDCLIPRQLVSEHFNLSRQILIDDDALVQGLARGLQPFNFDILILSGDVSFIKLLVDFDVRK